METPKDDFTTRTAQEGVEIEVALGDNQIEDDYFGKYKEERLTEETYTHVLQTPIQRNVLSISACVAHTICSKSTNTIANVNMRMAMYGKVMPHIYTHVTESYCEY